MSGDTAAKLEEKFASGEDFTFSDFLSQLEAMKNMGSMSKLMGLLPGAGQMKKQIENFDEGELVRTRAIIESMTPLERNNPKVLNGSRRARISRGSGRAISEINSLVGDFRRHKVLKQIAIRWNAKIFREWWMPECRYFRDAKIQRTIHHKRRNLARSIPKRALEEVLKRAIWD